MLNLLETQPICAPWSVPASALDVAELDAAVADAIRSLEEYNAWRAARDMQPSGGHVITLCFLAASASTEQFRSLVLGWLARTSLSDPHN